MIQVEDEGPFPYCDECADVLTRTMVGDDRGATDDPVVAERDRLREALTLLCSPVAGRTPEECEAETARRWKIAADALGEKR